MLKKLLLYTVLTFFAYQLNSQTIPTKNFQILDSLIKIVSSRIAGEILKKNIKNVILNFSDHPAGWLVKQHFYSAFTEKEIGLNSDSNGEAVVLNINIHQLEIQYMNDNNDGDSLIRNAYVHIDGNLSNNNKIDILENKLLEYTDKISRKDIDFIKSNYGFANAAVPEKKKTIFEEFAVPIIVVTTAILTVIILFTVRSG